MNVNCSEKILMFLNSIFIIDLNYIFFRIFNKIIKKILVIFFKKIIYFISYFHSCLYIKIF